MQIVRSTEDNMEDFYNITLHQLIKVCQSVSSKYTRSKVRKALPKEFAYIIEELLHEERGEYDKQDYFNRIIETIISTGQADAFIVAMCKVIQKLSIDQLHILGDVYDRGPGAHLIMDTLCHYGNWDIQWGNHDMLWMGAAAGNECCIANVVRVSLRYANLTTPLRTAMASTSYLWRQWQWKHTPTTPARNSHPESTRRTTSILKRHSA